ncbi:hypothetical protein NDU88_006533 [Pleurodeles waltl]|uniref:Uncharacterized protein n=1 Tax=Pleurodeles waltl TaxID=8319 RepID=A0AAV7MMK8_PLEWA|nr:hypothetical protein NDU88_006533 [Pleurodeles waltl]
MKKPRTGFEDRRASEEPDRVAPCMSAALPRTKIPTAATVIETADMKTAEGEENLSGVRCGPRGGVPRATALYVMGHRLHGERQ